MAMMMMERPKAKPRNRKSKNKTVSIPEVNEDFSSFESQPLEDILTLEFHVDEDHSDLPGLPGHCFASKINENHEDEDCQGENAQSKPRRKYKQAVTSSGQVYSIEVSEDSESEIEESPVKLRGVKVMFPRYTSTSIDYDSLRRDEEKRKENENEKSRYQRKITLEDLNTYRKELSKRSKQEQYQREQQLREKQLREQHLREQQLREQQLREQQLREQQLQERQLREQQLRKQQLREQELRKQELRNQELREQELREQELRMQELREQELRKQQLRKQEAKRKEVEEAKKQKEIQELVKRCLRDPRLPNPYYESSNAIHQLLTSTQNLEKPALLMGIPKVGKTSLVNQIAKQMNKKILEITYQVLDSIKHQSDQDKFLNQVFDQAAIHDFIVLIENLDCFDNEFRIGLMNKSLTKKIKLVVTTRNFSILPDRNKYQTVTMNLPSSIERMNIIQSYFKIDNIEAYENIANKLAGQTIKGIKTVLDHAKNIKVNDKIKLKRTFWQKILLRKRKYRRLCPQTVLLMKVEKAVNNRLKYI